jgi:hypothetical protein
MQEGDDMLVHINTMKALADQLLSRWTLWMKMFTWYSSLAFLHPLITLSQAWRPCPRKM